jgi:hypothetical protein
LSPALFLLSGCLPTASVQTSPQTAGLQISDQQNLQQLRDEQVLLTKERQGFITHARAIRMNQEEFSKKITVHYEKAARGERRETAIEDELNAMLILILMPE